MLHQRRNGKFFNQVDWVSTGSLLASVGTNIFMGFCKYKWLNEYNFNIPRFYLRYVDDILVDFEKEHDSLNFLRFLNNKHPNLW